MAKYDIPEGEYDVGDARFAIVVTRFNHDIVDRLCIEARPLHHRIQRDGGEIDRMDTREPPPTLAPGGADGFDDIGFGHVGLSISPALGRVAVRDRVMGGLRKRQVARRA